MKVAKVWAEGFMSRLSQHGIPQTDIGPVPMRAEADHLQAELIKVQLDLIYTIATSAHSAPNSHQFRQTSYDIARNGYNRLMRMLDPAMMRSVGIEPRINRARSAL